MSCTDPKTVRLTITPGNNNNNPGAQLENCDTLVIHWAGPGKFCVVSVTPSSPAPFNQVLPGNGNQNSGHEWTGVAQVDGAKIVYSTAGSTENCGSGKPVATGGNGTIQIGTGQTSKK